MTSLRHKGLDSARPAESSARPAKSSARPAKSSARPAKSSARPAKSSARPAERSSADTADLALDAARACILAVGWSRTTLTEVARRAGVSRMTIYRRWPDMNALLGDLMTREWSGLVRADDMEADALTGLVRGAVGTVRAVRANPLFARIVELDPQLLLPYLLDRPGRSQRLVLDVLAQQIRAGQESGDIRSGDAELLARSIVLACHGFTLSAQTMASDGLTEAQLDDELGALLTGYLQP